MSNAERLEVLGAALDDAFLQCLKAEFSGTVTLSVVIEEGEIEEVRRNVEERLMERMP
ncbi:hypothetical protein LCGC14_1231070 [marine sediment metagenome]|uniref:Uncharacterized protein n=1 Tax=marine sediment metagenome TaxID=412755 RepID=A0A0F9NQR3_9ZZZZ